MTGTGKDTISGASTLEFNSTIALGQTIDYSGANGILNLIDPLGYGGSRIDGFAEGDTVDLAGAWSLLNFSGNSSGTLGTLTLTDGTHNLAQLRRRFLEERFHHHHGSDHDHRAVRLRGTRVGGQAGADPRDLTAALAFALGYQGRKRVHA